MASYLCEEVNERHDARRVGFVIGIQYSRDRRVYLSAFGQPIRPAHLFEQGLTVADDDPQDAVQIWIG
ncbi:MAG: hypothetical protein ABSF62_11105 [Bryobacteraceae bacterium]